MPVGRPSLPGLRLWRSGSGPSASSSSSSSKAETSQSLCSAAHTQAAKCDPGTWDAEKRASDKHVTWGKGEGRLGVLRASLLRDKSIRRHICQLQAALGYEQEAECREER